MVGKCILKLVFEEYCGCYKLHNHVNNLVEEFSQKGHQLSVSAKLK